MVLVTNVCRVLSSYGNKRNKKSIRVLMVVTCNKKKMSKSRTEREQRSTAK